MKNDFSKAEIGQMLYSLRFGDITVREKTHNSCLICEMHDKSHWVWNYKGENSNEQKDLY